MGRAEFSGNYSHNIDPKGRATIPAAYREALSEGFTIGLNNDFNAIALLPRSMFETPLPIIPPLRSFASKRA